MSIIELCVENNLFDSVELLVNTFGSKIITPICISYASANNNRIMLRYLLRHYPCAYINEFYARRAISIITDLETFNILLPYIEINMKLLKRAIMVSNRSISIFLCKFCVKSLYDMSSLRDIANTYLNGNSIGILQDVLNCL